MIPHKKILFSQIKNNLEELFKNKITQFKKIILIKNKLKRIRIKVYF